MLNPRGLFVLAIIFGLGLSPGDAAAQWETTATPPVSFRTTTTPFPQSEESENGSAGHLVTQFFLGSAAGWTGGIALGILGANTIGPHSGEDPGLEGFIIGFPVGFVIGTAATVNWLAKRQGEPHSFGGAALGTIIGGAVALSAAAGSTDGAFALILGATIPGISAVFLNRAMGKPVEPAMGMGLNGRTTVGVRVRF
jgi:hypothetical protein